MLVNRSRIHAFTVLELIIVIALIGILSVMVTPRNLMREMSVNYEARRIWNDIRYTQLLSLLSGQRHRWVRVSTSTYQITNAAGNAILLPSGTTQYTLANGVTMSALSNLPNSLIAFDSLGVPYSDAGSPGTPLAAVAQITVSGQGATRVVNVTPQTGYTQLQ